MEGGTPFAVQANQRLCAEIERRNNMKKRLSLLLACAMLISCGCVSKSEKTTTAPAENADVSDTAVTTAAPEESDIADTTTVTQVSTEGAEAESAEKELTLEELGIENLSIKQVEIYKSKDLCVFYSTIEPQLAEIISDKSVRVKDEYGILVRETTTALFVGGDSSVSVDDKAFVDADEFETPFDIEWEKPVVNFSRITETDNPLESVELSYKVKNEIQVNAFVKKSGDKAQVIIDPVYMYNFPLFAAPSKAYEFNVNGTEFTADTFEVECGYDESKISLGDMYGYATVYLNDFVCRYDTKDGYSNTAVISDMKFITADTDNALNTAIFEDNPDKNPEMNEVYNAVVGSFETILTNETYGIKLLDMDFDGKPEVLVSKASQDDVEFYSAVDVDIYRVDNGALKYIDTIYNYSRITDMMANALGLKTLEDGTKCWFGTSRVKRDDMNAGESQTDYLYTLNGDKLEYTEVFSQVPKEGAAENSDYFGEKEDYYFFGEKVVPEITYDYEPFYDPTYDYAAAGQEAPKPDYPYYSWNGINATFGMWELMGFIRADFCKDIERKYTLYSDWLISGSNYYEIESVPLNARTAAYKVAYDIDKYYLGEYDADSMENDGYWFLGGYAKPVIYLYPEEKTEVSVEVEFAGEGEFTCTYPEYGEGWNVTAMPDGTLYDKDGNEYYCLYWEGDGRADFDMSKGFCVSGADTADFLREKLMYIGLSAREANEFIIYWLPVMQENEYNIITFHIDDYVESVPMTVTPAPDTLIRVFMTFASADEYVEIDAQELPSYERNGFTVVEWGGGEAVYCAD